MATKPATRLDRNLALELVRVTEYAALAAAREVGRGDKEAADQAAVDAMRSLLHSVHMDGVVVIGADPTTRRAPPTRRSRPAARAPTGPAR